MYNVEVQYPFLQYSNKIYFALLKVLMNKKDIIENGKMKKSPLISNYFKCKRSKYFNLEKERLGNWI